MRFAYDDRYHMDLNMVLYMVLCDNHTGYLGSGQDRTSMSLWISNYGNYDKKIRIICNRLVTAKRLFKDYEDFPGE